MEKKDLKIDGFLLKPRLRDWERVALAYEAELGNLDHQLYIPGKLVLGNFKDRKEGFILSPGEVYYRESGEQPFIEYGELFSKNEFEIVKPLSFRLSELESIAQQARAYRTARQNIRELITTTLNKYF